MYGRCVLTDPDLYLSCEVKVVFWIGGAGREKVTDDGGREGRRGWCRGCAERGIVGRGGGNLKNVEGGFRMACPWNIFFCAKGRGCAGDARRVARGPRSGRKMSCGVCGLFFGLCREFGRPRSARGEDP